MRRYITITAFILSMILGISSCQEPVIVDLPSEPVQDGYMRISFDAEAPDMSEVQTKVVDPDGEDISNMTLFCFDARGLFLSTSTAKLTPDPGVPSLSGSFDAVVPQNTERIHFVANQNMNLFNEGEFVARTETEVLSIMEGSSGMMIYWSRFVKDASSALSISDQIKAAGGVKLVRNHAKISVANPDNSYITITGFAAVNTNAFGTVAPYSDSYGWKAPTVAQPFVTIPHDESKLSDINDVRTIASEPSQYVFESPNTTEDPVSVILRGVKDGVAKYYRVMIMDEEGEYIPVMRNHSYVINITGDLSYGQDTFEAALSAAATNNVWILISDSIKQVQDNDYKLSVDETHIVLSDYTPGAYSLYYELAKVDGTAITAADQTDQNLTVTWLEGNNVAQQNFSNTYRIPGSAGYIGDGKTAEGEIIISLLPIGDEVKREGTILVKKGALQRKIKITTVKTQQFVPSWITTNVYGQGTGEKVTMMFTVSEDCPQELFPMEVYISVNDLDVRNESGMALPVIRKDDSRYGKEVYILGSGETDVFKSTDNLGNAKDPIGYKYVLTVETPGTQRLYFETILPHQPVGSELGYVDVTIEANHFESITKRATFQNQSDQYILIHNLRSYKAAEPADEVIYFYLVPQKKGAVVEFPTNLGKDIVWNADHTVQSYTPIMPSENDEFLFYSQYLDHREEEFFHFYTFNSSLWSTGGRVFGFKSNLPAGTPDPDAVFHLVTNSSRSEEVVRIASNPAGSPSVTGTGNSASNPYRSAVFELATFHPFHFGAEINNSGTLVSGQNEEVIDNISMDYGTEQDVVVEFDVTSFMSTIETVTVPEEQISVDPFGRTFEIYIDAPMLELADNPELTGKKVGGVDKLRKDPTKPGRYIYTVDADRETERGYYTAAAAITDNSVLDFFRKPIGAPVNQTGERKTIRFKTNRIVSAGDIVLSSQEDEVVYYQKTFKLNNNSIKGTIKYGDTPTSALTDVPARSFVPMERTYDNTRIGSMTITADGQYELRLRAEYDFNWYTDEIQFKYTKGETVYHVKFDSLNDLITSKDLVLVK